MEIKIGKELLYLTDQDTMRVSVSMKEYIDALEEGFIAKGQGKVQMPYKVGADPDAYSIVHAMPC